ncbi:Class I SAM-dependent methyltransferase domain protein [Candidatus Bealeia paramacronuclearis]|uniref:Class I SAM-dependent methyltransferase domain protein n=1 Tax=Candidatus Bealeia paramacronuclearis TaxID=1921001 RepID=A0ABZ2C218_9PROT|nr:Class I SAM-dependent methyltransferase domain protein [Candidatus Bealeia paramacronuclearis]
MWPDVVDMRDFYSSTLGNVVRRLIRKKIREFWPDVKGDWMMALGYPTPFLRQYREEARNTMAIMPAEQGALSWSNSKPNIVILSGETQLPLADQSIDRVLLIHALEYGHHNRHMIREVWRVLKDGGRLLVVVPNRTSIWARVDRTPFGQGHPFTLSQLSRLLRDNLFTPIQSDHALYVPPLKSRFILSTSMAWESLGHRWFHKMSGVILMEASKQIYAGALTEAAAVAGKKVRITKPIVAE